MTNLKKGIFLFIAFTLAVWSVGLAVLPVKAVTIADGDLVKAADAPAVYLIQGAKKRVFPHLNVYLSWGYPSDFSTVKTASASELAAYEDDNAVPFRDGSLFRGTATSLHEKEACAVFYVEAAKLRAVISEAVYMALFNDADWSLVTWVPDDLLSKFEYSLGTGLDSSAVLPDGLLVKYGDQYGIIAAGAARYFSSDAAISANRYDKAKAVVLAAAPSEGSAITGAESDLLAVGWKKAVVVGLSAALAADSAAAATIPDGSLYNEMLKVNLTAGSAAASVTGIKVTKGGLTDNTNISGVSIWDEAGVRHGNIITTLSTDNDVTILFASSPIEVPAGSTKAFYVKVSFDSTTSGTAYFYIAKAADITTTATVSGSFPITGAVMTIVDGADALGSYIVTLENPAGLNEADVSASTGNLEIGQTQKEVAKVKLNATSNAKEDIKFEKIVLYLEGNIVETTDLGNFKLYTPDGTVLATADKAADRYVTFALATPYTIKKGYSKTLPVKVDVLSGSSRYFNAWVKNDYDVVIKGAVTGSYIAPSSFASGGVEASAGGWFKMKAGSLTVTKAVTSLAGTIAQAAEIVKLASFDIKAVGEKLELRELDITINDSGASGLATTDFSGNITVQDSDGNVYYAGAVTGFTIGTAEQCVLSSYITLEAGASKLIHIIGNIAANAVDTHKFLIGVQDWYAKRYSTNDYLDLSTAEVQANVVEIDAGSLIVAKNVAMGNKNISPGTTKAKIGSFVLSAGSAENVNITSLTVDVTASGGATELAKIVNLELYDGSTQLGSTISTLAATGNAFTVAVTVGKSQAKVIDVKANLGSTLTPTGTVIVDVSAASASGATTGEEITAVNSAGTAISTANVALQTITFTAAEATFSRDSASPASQIITAGQSGVILEKLKIAAKYDDLTLEKIRFEVENVDGESAAMNFAKVYLYDGSTKLGEQSMVSNEVLFDGLAAVIPMDGAKILTIKADITDTGTLAPINTSGATPDDLTGKIQIKSDATADMTLKDSLGVALAAAKINGATSADIAASNWFLFHDVKPVITKASDSPSGASVASSDQAILKFNIKADGTRDMSLTKIAITVSASGLDSNDSVSTFDLYQGVTKIATDTSTTVDSTTSTQTISFDTSNDINSAFDDLTLTAGSSQDFILKANTSTLTPLATADVNLVAKITGNIGYASGNTTAEYDWAEGNVYFSYTPIGGSVLSVCRAADEYPIVGNTLIY